MSFLIRLSDDTISIILDYLTPQEFTRIVYLTTKKSCISGPLVRRETIKHLKRTWKISDKDLNRFVQSYNRGQIDFKKYLQFAVPILGNIRLYNLKTPPSSTTDLILLENQAIKFQGVVGSGNRSIVSTESFPAGSSAFLKIVADMEQAMKHRSLQELVNIMKRVKKIILDRSSKDSLNSLSDIQPPIFSSPFLYKTRSISRTVNGYTTATSHWESTATHMEYSQNEYSRKAMSRASSFNSLHEGSGSGGVYTVQSYLQPRSVAYFEVKIERNRESIASSETELPGLQWPVGEGGMLPGDMPTECVAVGLSTSAFDQNEKMPGWDCESYGYHGDDGGIFHGGGHKFDEYGPAFGPGDVVGCGLDYTRKEIFYTLNGTYLGPAFMDINIGTCLYPTIGVDAHVSVSFNFGRQPFEYDLAEHIDSTSSLAVV